MLVTIDTNILYQALRGNSGASHFILKMIRSRQIQMALSVPVFSEYQEVLTRKKSLTEFGLSFSDIERFLRYIAYVGRPYEIFYLLRPNLVDETDNKFVELAVTSQSDYLITSNIKDYRNFELRFESFQTITPADFVRTWRKKHG